MLEQIKNNLTSIFQFDEVITANKIVVAGILQRCTFPDTFFKTVKLQFSSGVRRKILVTCYLSPLFIIKESKALKQLYPSLSSTSLLYALVNVSYTNRLIFCIFCHQEIMYFLPMFTFECLVLKNCFLDLTTFTTHRSVVSVSFLSCRIKFFVSASIQCLENVL